MKTMVFYVLFLSLLSFRDNNHVFICNSLNAKAYHKNDDCKGLEKCTHEIKEITIDEALNKKLKPCKVCLKP